MACILAATAVPATALTTTTKSDANALQIIHTALAQKSNGYTAAAISTLENLTLFQCNNSVACSPAEYKRAQLELASLYYINQQYLLSKNLLSEVISDKKIPKNVRINAQKLLDSVEKKLNQKNSHAFFANVQIATGYDSNALIDPDFDTIQRTENRYVDDSDLELEIIKEIYLNQPDTHKNPDKKEASYNEAFDSSASNFYIDVKSEKRMEHMVDKRGNPVFSKNPATAREKISIHIKPSADVDLSKEIEIELDAWGKPKKDDQSGEVIGEILDSSDNANGEISDNYQSIRSNLGYQHYFDALTIGNDRYIPILIGGAFYFNRNYNDVDSSDFASTTAYLSSSLYKPGEWLASVDFRASTLELGGSRLADYYTASASLNGFAKNREWRLGSSYTSRSYKDSADYGKEGSQWNLEGRYTFHLSHNATANFGLSLIDYRANDNFRSYFSPEISSGLMIDITRRWSLLSEFSFSNYNYDATHPTYKEVRDRTRQHLKLGVNYQYSNQIELGLDWSSTVNKENISELDYSKEKLEGFIRFQF